MRVNEIIFEAVKQGNSIILTHPTYPKAFVEINLKSVWGEGEPEEQILPTLEMVFVPIKLRGKGVGKELITLVLKYMGKHRIPFLVFDNFDHDFWDSVTHNFPNLVYWIKPRGKWAKSTGFLKRQPNVDVTSIF
jgi:hypothetical protein